MRVLVTGGCGFIGLAAAKALHQAGHEVRLLSSRRSGDYAGFPVVHGDVRQPGSLGPAVEKAEAVVIAHQFPHFPIERPASHHTFWEVDAEGTQNVVAAIQAQNTARSLVYLSGAAVRDNAAGQHPGIDAKLAAERHVRDNGLPWTILRASIVYGPGDHAFSRLAELVNTLPVVPIFGDGRALSEPIHVDDLAHAITGAVGSPQGLLYACGPNALSMNATLDLLMQALGQRRRLVHLPLGLVNIAATILERLPHPPLTRGLVAFTQFDNTRDGRNADDALGLTFRTIDIGIREVYGNRQTETAAA